MTEFQFFTIMIGFGGLLVTVIFGLINVMLSILNLYKKN